MNIKSSIRIVLLSSFALSTVSCAEDFVVKKRRPQSQSMNKLKEDYASELADLVKLIPHLQKQLATLQEELIDELYKIMDDDIQIGKVELDSRTCKAHELRCFLDKEFEHALPSKSSFVQPKKKAVCVQQAVKETLAQ